MERSFQFFSFRGTISHPMIIIPDLPNIVIEDISVANEIRLTVRTTFPTACCSSCGTRSERVQSRYMRTLHDLPASGHPVTLLSDLGQMASGEKPCQGSPGPVNLPSDSASEEENARSWSAEGVCFFTRTREKALPATGSYGGAFTVKSAWLDYAQVIALAK